MAITLTDHHHVLLIETAEDNATYNGTFLINNTEASPREAAVLGELAAQGLIRRVLDADGDAVPVELTQAGERQVNR
jgi:hypothetical protein